MSLNSLIKKIIKEETEEWVDISPEEYKELLDYVNGDGSIIKRLPDYNGKKIRITGELDLRGKENVTNIDSIDLVQGNLDIGYTKIPFFDKNKVRGRLDYWGSEMQRLEKQKIYELRIAYQNELREEGAWNVENDDKESMYSVKDLMYIHERIGIPIVFDYHHHKFCTGDLSEQEALELAISTWPKDIKPIVHYSESKALHESDDKLKPQAHSDYINDLPDLYGNDVDVMVEAKAKELSILPFINL